MKIQGIEGMSAGELQHEISRGGRLVLYQYCVSVVLLTFLRPTDVYLVRVDDNAVVKGLGWTGLTLLLGWWGIPWGPIYTIKALVNNLRGGKDVTVEVMQSLAA